MEETLMMTAQAALFFLTLWLAGCVFERLQLSALVGEICVGIVMGHGGLNLVPDRHGFMLLGKVGIFWLLFDGGAHLEVDMLRETGLVSFLIALTGVVAPLLLVWGTMVLVGFSSLEAFTMGTALAPTSGGMAVKLMADAGVLQTKIGQTIVCSAMTDDVFSLVILAIVSNLGGDSADDQEERSQMSTWIEICTPIVTTLAFTAVVAMIAKFMPKILMGRSSTVVGPLMCITAVVFALICQAIKSSEYMGSFLAGVCFANVYVDPGDTEEPQAVPSSEAGALSLINGDEAKGPKLEKVPEWLEKRSPAVLEAFFVSVFFASAGFLVPVKVFAQPETMGLGGLCSVVALAGKLVAGVWIPNSRWCVGWAMVARGELGFVMAASAHDSHLTSTKALNVTIWAVLSNTLISPPIFQYLLRSIDPSGRNAGETEEQNEDDSDSESRTKEGASEALSLRATAPY